MTKKGNIYKLIKEKYDKSNHIKIDIIRHIPIVFLIFLIICIILIYYSSNNNYNENIKLMLDKFCNLFMGMTIVIAGMYLLCTRLEHVYTMNNINNKIINMEENAPITLII